ncbi:MAG: hypothetical protein ABI747_00185 [Candidatus Moraniibacteriota bacterium]
MRHPSLTSLYKLQAGVLSVGTLFAWYTVYVDFSRFYHFYGTLFRTQDCVIPNPVTTPCFYGAFAFLAAFIWSLTILRDDALKRGVRQKKLHLLLIASVLFAWSNFSWSAYKFYTVTVGPRVACSGVPAENIFSTPCFIGASIFLTAFLVSVFILRNTPQTNSPERIV